MKSFKQFMVEAHKKEKPKAFFAHYKSKNPKHNIEHKKDEPVEFFPHYRLNDPKHNIEQDKKLKENGSIWADGKLQIPDDETT